MGGGGWGGWGGAVVGLSKKGMVTPPFGVTNNNNTTQKNIFFETESKEFSKLSKNILIFLEKYF